METNTGKVGEFCQSGKVGTMTLTFSKKGDQQIRTFFYS